MISHLCSCSPTTPHPTPFFYPNIIVLYIAIDNNTHCMHRYSVTRISVLSVFRDSFCNSCSCSGFCLMLRPITNIKGKNDYSNIIFWYVTPQLTFREWCIMLVLCCVALHLGSSQIAQPVPLWYSFLEHDFSCQIMLDYTTSESWFWNPCKPYCTENIFDSAYVTITFVCADFEIQ